MSEKYHHKIAHAIRNGKETLHESGTDGIVIPHNSPVYKKPRKRKGKIREPFAPMKKEYFQLSDSEFKIFAAMLLMGGWHGDVRLITRPMIQEITGKSKATITRALAGLKRKGFIERRISPRKSGALWKVNTEAWEIARSGDVFDLHALPNDEFNGSKMTH